MANIALILKNAHGGGYGVEMRLRVGITREHLSHKSGPLLQSISIISVSRSVRRGFVVLGLAITNILVDAAKL